MLANLLPIENKNKLRSIDLVKEDLEEMGFVDDDDFGNLHFMLPEGCFSSSLSLGAFSDRRFTVSEPISVEDAILISQTYNVYVKIIPQ